LKKDEDKENKVDSEESEDQPKKGMDKTWEVPKGYFRTRDTTKKMELIEKMKKIQSGKKKRKKKKS